jgi:NADH-quinone oxidoreductase subunit E
MVNWEFFDNQTPESATALVDGLRSGDLPTPTRGASLCTFKQVSRVLAGFYDGRADEGPAAGPATLAGLEIYREQQEEERAGRHSADRSRRSSGSGSEPQGYGRPESTSGADAPAATAKSDPANASPTTEKDGDA